MQLVVISKSKEGFFLINSPSVSVTINPDDEGISTASLKLASLASILSAIQKIRMSCQVDTFDVIIVGAGISGLMAARTLLMSRPTMRVQVLEASARTGGRIHTIQTAGGDLIELGAQWCEKFP